MSESDDPSAGDTSEHESSGHDFSHDAAPDEASDSFAEVREAAGAVVASLKWLIDATERVVEDPEAFGRAVDGGRSVVEAFLGGFAAQMEPDDATTAERGESGPES